jgi:hypothetical protein
VSEVRAAQRRRSEELAERRRALREARANEPQRVQARIDNWWVRIAGGTIVGIAGVMSLGNLSHPTVLSPWSLPTLLLACLSGGPVAPFIAWTSVFLLWYPRPDGERRLRLRSVVLALGALALSLQCCVEGPVYGLYYQGVSYVGGVILVNVACWSAIFVLGLTAALRPGRLTNWIFEVVLFAWIAWFAFPYMGEMI